MILNENNALREYKPISFWVCYALTGVSAATSVGFAVAGLVASPHDSFALYAAGRSLVLVLLVGAILLRPLREGLALLAPAMALVQALDAVTGAIIADPVTTWGPAVLAALGVVSFAVWFRSRFHGSRVPGAGHS